MNGKAIDRRRRQRGREYKADQNNPEQSSHNVSLLPFDRSAVDLDARDVDEPAPPVAASGQKSAKPISSTVHGAQYTT